MKILPLLFIFMTSLTHGGDNELNFNFVREAVGPSPWGWRNGSVVADGKKFSFRNQEQAITEVINPEGHVILIVGPYCYARFLRDGRTLLWWEEETDETRFLHFSFFRLQELKKIPDPQLALNHMQRNEQKTAGLTHAQIWRFSALLPAGDHIIDAPKNWSDFEETIVLSDHDIPKNPAEEMARAIFIFSWTKQTITVLPQDWFNKGRYDFGYQWITQIKRTESGQLIGDGIRLGVFELDASGRQIKRWVKKQF